MQKLILSAIVASVLVAGIFSTAQMVSGARTESHQPVIDFLKKNVIPLLNNISTEVLHIENKLDSPIAGLNETKKEVREIEKKLDDNATGLKEIKKEVSAIGNDLLFKKRFYQIVVKEGPHDFPGKFEAPIEFTCKLPNATACAFNVESLQVTTSGTTINLTSSPAIFFKVVGITVDGVRSNITPIVIDPSHTGANILVETRIGQIGASHKVALNIECPDLTNQTIVIEWNGEQPQGGSLSASLPLSALTAFGATGK